MKIDHIGIVVSSIPKAMELWATVFQYAPMTETVINTHQKVKVVFLRKDNSTTVKLIEPTDETSPVYRFALKGGGLHHLCFRCDDVESETQRLRSLGLRVLSPPEAGEAFENHQIAFIYATGIGLNFELIDTDVKACRVRY